MEMYSRDTKNHVRYFCNGDLPVTKAVANWRDSIAFDFLDGQLEPQIFPEICRKEVSEYMKHMIKLRTILSDVPFVQGALVINIGDFIQLVANDKFRSVEHRVLAQRFGPRISVACLFFPSTMNKFEAYEAIKELLSQSGHPPIYRGTYFAKYIAYFRSK